MDPFFRMRRWSNNFSPPAPLHGEEKFRATLTSFTSPEEIVRVKNSAHVISFPLPSCPKGVEGVRYAKKLEEMLHGVSKLALRGGASVTLYACGGVVYYPRNTLVTREESFAFLMR